MLSLSPPLGQCSGASGDRLPGIPVGSHPDQLPPHHHRHLRTLRHNPVPTAIRHRGEFYAHRRQRFPIMLLSLSLSDPQVSASSNEGWMLLESLLNEARARATEIERRYFNKSANFNIFLLLAGWYLAEDLIKLTMQKSVEKLSAFTASQNTFVLSKTIQAVKLRKSHLLFIPAWNCIPCKRTNVSIRLCLIWFRRSVALISGVCVSLHSNKAGSEALSFFSTLLKSGCHTLLFRKRSHPSAVGSSVYLIVCLCICSTPPGWSCGWPGMFLSFVSTWRSEIFQE